jgi:mRNA-degrading endonuclease RelE of RelBE toxin-antitoxin system
MRNNKYTVVFDPDELDGLSNVYRNAVRKKLPLFETNPFHPSFRTKKMKGGSGFYESSINMSIRMIWFFRGDKIIVILNIGHHDILKKY